MVSLSEQIRNKEMFVQYLIEQQSEIVKEWRRSININEDDQSQITVEVCML